jgi:regulation of enolase protein 1 (concanavalin A-like superfamily)
MGEFPSPVGNSDPSMWQSFQWLNPPDKWEIADGRLSVDVSPKSDFWRKTHYGFVRDSGHFFHRQIAGDFVAQVRFRGEYSALYDQGGLMLRASDQHWLKCGIEYVNGTQQASVVATNDFSDWSVTPLRMNPHEVWFRVARQDCSLEVFYSLDGEDYSMLRIAYLKCSRDLNVGVMCAAPEGPGFRMEFSDFSMGEA